MKRSILTTFFMTVFAGLFVANGWAAPTISSVSGTFSPNQLVTISGSGFGSKAKAAPVLWDAVDGISSYSSLTDGATVPVGGNNPWPDNPYSALKIETTDTMRHSNSKKMYKASGTKGSLGDLLLSGGTGKIYLSYWWKPDKTPNGYSHSSKFVRLSNYSDRENLTFSWTQMQSYTYIKGCDDSIWHDWPGNVGQWNFHEILMDSAAKTYTMYVNGVQVGHNSWSGCPNTSYDTVWGVGWDGGGSSPPSITTWMDDIYVDNIFARVFIGNGSTFASSTKREMQIPSEWSSSRIAIKVNPGAFSANQKVYLYVVDSTGAVNSNGYPITIGASSDGGSSTPATLSKPQNINIVN